ncbi:MULTISPECIES: TRAP transporter substrate-binding protein [Sulfitobacter]|jgi:TRAP-type mannitol/chloroaromatic compound transport system substrate-binding protein|uniref:Alpha-keto acid-binding periplasmic protein TakP n=4 Tax=Sulfitobacter TaxID=60136 RepID=A0A1H2WGQ4_9RHOB|nr:MULTISPECIES: TRAP transporter substrate-binding protein [Sulfitobacter]HCT33262.1 C4-dicarboxylate ABC transporter [Sulfitobacter sp.]OAN73767.1 C4-dicarboxylate ABC transporter [Sulfitobacter pontiacus]PTA98424.1 C4-dicarboxylate ABC transporter [Sulfitobacter sp. CB-A]QLL42123.1 TRAP transporter substrate-binding protein [Sulfitobacter pontiacus]QPO09732.1 TRAP transporter substrate-binding protein [Sulfitobacter sp. B30-2]|tara:strand:- start:13469 stop:14599 length:1131 start_codon:yes stop_codon:yes gene_type:complete
MKTNNSINRRSFLTKSAVAGGAAAGSMLAAPAVLAQAPLVIKMQTSWNDANIWQDFARDYATRVEEMSGGRVKVDVLPAGAVVAAFQVLDAVNDGLIDAAHSVPVYWYGKNKAASLFGTGPVFGGSATTMLSWFYEGGGQELYNELTQDIMGLDVVGYMGFPMFAQPFGWFKEEVNSVEDLQGFKYRTVGLAADLMAKLGMSVAQLPGGEIVPAMERGVIDAFEFNNPSSDKDFGAQDVAKNYYLSSYHQASESFEFLFSRTFLEDLDPDLQAILKYAVEAASTANTAKAMNRYSADLQFLQDEAGVTVRRTSKEILDAQLKAWDELIPELEADPFMKKTLDSQREWVSRVSYYELMNSPDYGLAYEHYFPGKIKL